MLLRTPSKVEPCGMSQVAPEVLVSYPLDTPESECPSEKTALLFPGQGSQSREMRHEVMEFASELLEIAASELGVDPFDHVDEGTVYLQPVVYCGTISRWRAMGEPRSGYAAGHSLGEIAALVAAGCIGCETGMHLVLTRGRLMQSAADAQPPGGLLALIGDRESALALAGELRLTVALDNEPAQVVVAGERCELERGRAVARKRGLRAVRLSVPAALHSPAMSAALAPFREALAQVMFAEPQMTVLSNVTARPFNDFREELALALTCGVRFRETVLGLHAAGVCRFLEVGSHSTLTGLVERTLGADQARDGIER